MNQGIVSALTNGFSLIVPEIVLGVAACFFFLGATFWANRNLWASASIAVLCVAGILVVRSPLSPSSSNDAIFAGSIFLDSLALWVKATAIVGGLVLVLLGWKEVPDRIAAEYYACLIIIIAGLCLVGVANDLVTLYLALEMISIPTYILLYITRWDKLAQEAALKYFLLSVFTSSLLLFGFSYLYGLSGTTNIPAMVDALTREDPHRLPPVILIALVMIVAGLSFKITAVPFHFYAPDVYQGASTPAVALLAFVPKVAGFVSLIRVLGFVWAGKTGSHLALGDQVPNILYVVAAVTMSLGNILALLQTNVKRLLAYSSVAHAGYMLIGLSVAHHLSISPSSVWIPGGVEAVLFYLVAYGAMTIGAFGVLAYLSTPARPVEAEDDLAGLSQSHPGIALLMALFLFSLIGIPFTAGFLGKLFLLLGAMAVEGDRANLFRLLAFIGVLNAAIGGWYYLRIVAKMYLQSPVKPLERPRSLPGLLSLWICGAITLFLGIYPAPLLRQAARAAVSHEESASLALTDGIAKSPAK